MSSAFIQCQSQLHGPGSHFVCTYYRPQTKLRKGNVFTGVCDSVHGGGVSAPGGAWSGGVPGLGGVCSRGCLGVMPGPGGSAPGGGGCLVETPSDGYCCGWYASYRNAFLFFNF